MYFGGQSRRQQLGLLLMKDLLVFGEDVVDLAGRDDDAALGQLVLKQRLSDVVVMILVQDMTDEHRSEVLAG